ncbi:hypothetical protein L7F22_027548 [Adiantum nelumboides]|nr:hypothetical protein [Adiantum nelumboides]
MALQMQTLLEPGHRDCRKSTSGYVFTFTSGAVSWISRLQKCVALSTIEAEYVAATEATKVALWLMRLVGELGIDAKFPVLHCDSQSAIMLVRNPVFHAKTKHIEVKYHFIRHVLEDKAIELVKVHTDDNPMDMLTKSLSVESNLLSTFSREASDTEIGSLFELSSRVGIDSSITRDTQVGDLNWLIGDLCSRMW